MKPCSKSVWIAPAACGADQAIEARLLQPDIGEEMLALLARQHRDLGLDLGRDDDRRLALLRRAALDRA